MLTVSRLDGQVRYHHCDRLGPHLPSRVLGTRPMTLHLSSTRGRVGEIGAIRLFRPGRAAASDRPACHCWQELLGGSRSARWRRCRWLRSPSERPLHRTPGSDTAERHNPDTAATVTGQSPRKPSTHFKQNTIFHNLIKSKQIYITKIIR